MRSSWASAGEPGRVMAETREARPLRIAIVLDKFLPSRGGERYFTFLCEELAKRGHDVHVFATQAEQTTGLSYQVHEMRIPRHPDWLRILALWSYKIRTPDGRPFDVVHGVAQCRDVTLLNPHGGVEAAYLRQEFASIENKLYRIYKCICHGLSLRRRLEMHFQNNLYAGGRVRRIIAISEMVKRDIIEHYAFPADRIDVVFNSVDLDAFSLKTGEAHRAQKRAELGLSDETILLLFAGNNFRLKGVATLLKALALLIRKHADKDFRLLIAGRGRAGRYGGLIRRLGIEDKVDFAGPVSPMAPYYAAADIYVHPTFYDSCSLTVLEALAMGLPSITTRFNGAAQAIRSDEGGKVIENPADAEELTGAIGLFVEKEKREKAGKAAREWVEEWGPERNIQETLAAYYASIEGL